MQWFFSYCVRWIVVTLCVIDCDSLFLHSLCCCFTLHVCCIFQPVAKLNSPASQYILLTDNFTDTENIAKLRSVYFSMKKLCMMLHPEIRCTGHCRSLHTHIAVMLKSWHPMLGDVILSRWKTWPVNKGTARGGKGWMCRHQRGQGL